MWKHKGKPTSNVPVTTTTTPLVAIGTTTAALTPAADSNKRLMMTNYRVGDVIMLEKMIIRY